MEWTISITFTEEDIERELEGMERAYELLSEHRLLGCLAEKVIQAQQDYMNEQFHDDTGDVIRDFAFDMVQNVMDSLIEASVS